MRFNESALLTRPHWILAGIVFLAFCLRLNVIVGSMYHWDEEREWIPFAQSISLEPGQVNLPIRVISHPILPAYLIKLGTLIAGENPLGFRFMSLLAGTAAVWVVALTALQWRGFWAAFWAASLLAFNEYHIYVSSLAIDKPFQLFFCSLAVAAFMRFLQTESSKYLYFAGALTGVAFLCKETAALLLPGFLVAMLLSTRHRPWLARGAPYIAVVVFAAVISPDLFINFFMTDELEYSYSDHLGRAAGIGFTRHHFLFFARGAIATVYGFMGEHLSDLAPEYASMNSLLGLLMLGVAGFTAARLAVSRVARQDGAMLYLAAAFWIIFGTFLFTEVSTEGAFRHLTYVAWFWSDMTLIPGSLMAGAFLASLEGRWKVAGTAAASIAALTAIAAAVVTRVGTPSGPNAAINPEYILPPNGQLIEATAAFNFCMICEKNVTARLVDVELHRPDAPENELTSVLGSDFARLDPGSSDGTQLLLRARDGRGIDDTDEQWYEMMWYDVTYALTDPDGREHIVVARSYSPLEPSEFSPPFWSGEPQPENRR